VPKLTIGRKIYAIITLCLLGSIGVSSFELRQFSIGLLDQKQIELKHLGDIALGIVKEEYASTQKGGTSADEAQKRAAARVASLRYGNDDYFWINDMQPRMVMHPMKPELNGIDLSDNKDTDGKRLFVEFADTVKQSGSGFVAYQWPKPGADRPQPKLSYVVGFAPWGWVIGTGVYIDDLQQQVSSARNQVVLIVIVIALITGAIAVAAARNIAGPIRRIGELLLELARGNKAVEIPYSERADEVGDNARAAKTFREFLLRMEAMEAEKKDAEAHANAERKADMKKLAERIRASVGTIVTGLNGLSDKVQGSTAIMHKNASATCERIDAAVADLDVASADVATVASAVTELAASINEISSQTVQSTQSTAEVLSAAQAAERMVQNLTQASRRIGDISSLINTIAAQTNLLALNATIEAARAGDAGRGFAVVASEVKALASQTARATEDINKQVVEIRRALEDVVGAVGKINQTTGSVQEISTSIAGAVEEQNAATGEISDSVQRAAGHTRQVINGIADLPAMAKDIQSAAGSLAGLTIELGGQASMLDREIERLLLELSERRAHGRFAADADVRVTVGAAETISKLLDVSASGGRLALLPGVAIGQTVYIGFSDGVRLEARVAWIANNQFGVNFDPNRLAPAQLGALQKTDSPLAA